MWRSDYDDAYETCARTNVELHVFSERESQTITDTLGMMPTASNADRWTLSSERYVQSFDFRRHLDWLLDRLESRASALHEIQSEPSLTGLTS